MHSKYAEKIANQAVFIHQLNTEDAIRFIAERASVNEQIAQSALQAVVTFHQNPCESVSA